MKCCYCNKEIINEKRKKGDNDYSKVYRSSEHIIQNAIGGKLESDKICCDRCNFHIEDLIDKKFCSIFAPLTSKIDRFRKTNNSNSSPKYSGYAMYNKDNKNIIISADVIKKSKLMDSRELIEIEKQLGTDDLKNRLKEAKKRVKILFEDFKLDNIVFNQGISKIAYNYAVYLGIQPNSISNVCEVTLEGKNKEISNVYFNTKVIPFYPGNELDRYIELEKNVALYHNLILYRWGKELWCYVELFNTFQYYVLLSKNFLYSGNKYYEVYGEEFQYVQAGMNAGDVYNKIVMEKIRESLKKNSNLANDFSYNFYVSQDRLKEIFRIINPLKKYSDAIYEMISYPLWITQAKSQEQISEYTTEKFVKLNQYLIKDNPTIVYADFFKMSEEDQDKYLCLLLKSIEPKKNNIDL